MVYTPLEHNYLKVWFQMICQVGRLFGVKNLRLTGFFHHFFQGVSRASLPRFDPARYKQTKVVMAPLGLGVYICICIYIYRYIISHGIHGTKRYFNPHEWLIFYDNFQ